MRILFLCLSFFLPSFRPYCLSLVSPSFCLFCCPLCVCVAAAPRASAVGQQPFYVLSILGLAFGCFAFLCFASLCFPFLSLSLSLSQSSPSPTTSSRLRLCATVRKGPSSHRPGGVGRKRSGRRLSSRVCHCNRSCYPPPRAWRSAEEQCSPPSFLPSFLFPLSSSLLFVSVLAWREQVSDLSRRRGTRKGGEEIGQQLRVGPAACVCSRRRLRRLRRRPSPSLFLSSPCLLLHRRYLIRASLLVTCL